MNSRFTQHIAFSLPLLAIILTLPALWVGLQFDDYLHRQTILNAHHAITAIMDLFIFMEGDPVTTYRLMDSGEFPWWALPEGKVAFWRPVSAFTHWLDYQLWPTQPTLMHLHSILWFGLLIGAIVHFYRQLMPTPALALLAALLYTIDDAHGFAVGWLSNRNAILATLFGVLALCAHHQWRHNQSGKAAWLAPFSLALGLLSAEAAIATLAYLLAYALFLERGTWPQRLFSLCPALCTVIIWRIIYRSLGYGAWGTSYIDPLGEPLRYIMAAIERVPILLLAQWALPPAELYPFVSTFAVKAVWWVLAIITLLFLTWHLWPHLRSDRNACAHARFWACGMLLSTLPPAASLPANRLLFFIGLGAMGLLATLIPTYTHIPPTEGNHSFLNKVGRYLIAHLSSSKTASTLPLSHSPTLPLFVGHTTHYVHTSTTKRLTLIPLIAIHLLLAPLMLPLTAYSPALFGNIEPAINSLPLRTTGGCRACRGTEQDLIIINAPTFFATGYIAPIRTFNQQPLPKRIRFLGADLTALELTRPDPHTLLIRPTNGYITAFDPVFRSPHHPFHPNDTLQLTNLHITIHQLTPDNRPALVAYHFPHPLENPRYRWLQWQNGAYVPFTLPAVGETVLVEGIGVDR